MRTILDTNRQTVGVDTVASRDGHTITRRRYYDHEAKVLAHRPVYQANIEEASLVERK